MHEILFLLSYEISDEKCSEIFSEMFEPLFCGSEKNPVKFPPNFLGSDLGRADFFFGGIFIFGPPDFFRGFCCRIFLLISVEKKCPEQSSRKIPGKLLQNLYNKNPRHISAEGPGQDIVQASKKSTKIDFLGPETAGWGGGLPREVVVVQSLFPPSKVCLPWVSKGGAWDARGILPGCPGPLGVFQ